MNVSAHYKQPHLLQPLVRHETTQSPGLASSTISRGLISSRCSQALPYLRLAQPRLKHSSARLHIPIGTGWRPCLLSAPGNHSQKCYLRFLLRVEQLPQ